MIKIHCIKPNKQTNQSANLVMVVCIYNASPEEAETPSASAWPASKLQANERTCLSKQGEGSRVTE